MLCMQGLKVSCAFITSLSCFTIEETTYEGSDYDSSVPYDFDW